MKTSNEFFERLLAIVPTGRENAIPMLMLANITGMSPRELRQCICMARMNGYFILSSADGYFKPSTLMEAHEFLNYMHAGAMTRLKSLQPLRNTLKEFGVVSTNNIPLYVDEDQEFPVKCEKPSEKKKVFQCCYLFNDEMEELE